MRYKDIIDYISDDFLKNTSQTPFFVVQADYTEKFCVINKTLKDYLSNLSTNIIEEIGVKVVEYTLIDKIKKQALEYRSKEQALQLIIEIKEELSEYMINSELSEIYESTILFQENYDGIVNKNAIGKWLDENSHEYFAKSSHTRERKDRFTNLFGGIQAATAGLSRYLNDSEYEWVRNGFELEIEVPYKTIFFTLKPKFPNVESYTCRIIYFLSKKQIRFFYFLTNFETKNWDELKLNTKIEWLTTEYSLSNQEEIINGLNSFFLQLEEKAKNELEERFKTKDALKD